MQKCISCGVSLIKSIVAMINLIPSHEGDYSLYGGGV